MTMDSLAFLKTLEQRVSLTSEDKSILQANAAWGLEIAPAMADHFYAYLGRDSEMNAILNQNEGRVHRLHETFIQWFHQMFTGMDDWGDEYAKCRWHIGVIHVKIGIVPQYVVPAMGVVVHEVGRTLKASGKPDELQESLGKICMIDLAFIEQAYVEVARSAVLRETGWSEALFKRLVATGASSL
ncbi:protoglobin domain-containing protein [Nodularia harveyana UHCC-0300]|uniref:Protoglobin domain-containing protein n=1 Tax=Nodularia harveyana UHCC-0300 TaxID=2974287 RepID=A0ABU5UHA7_9CYAN|nr:protoglobin domain-containing protein [Nodularia harveyana]MEA5582609.1 protoglobin domain-containing protein [Nodularia harveyana UHCC-0300]